MFLSDIEIIFTRSAAFRLVPVPNDISYLHHFLICDLDCKHVAYALCCMVFIYNYSQSPINRHSQLAPMKACVQKFPCSSVFIGTVDIAP